MEIIQALLLWEKVSSNNGDFHQAGTVKATDAVMAMALNIFQMKGRGFAIPGIVDRNRDTPLIAGVCFRGAYIVSFKVSRVNNTFRVGVALLLGKAGTGEDGKADMEGFKIEESLL